MRALALRPRALGDVVLVTPALRALSSAGRVRRKLGRSFQNAR